MLKRHGRSDFYVIGEGVYSQEPAQTGARPASEIEELRKFRFSRIAPASDPLPVAVLEQLAAAMVGSADDLQSSALPAGFTYLGQFVDHDLTLDKTALSLGTNVSVEELVQGRSPSLDLDSLYGLGPQREPQFYVDGVHLKLGETLGTDFPRADPVAGRSLVGFDLPRLGSGPAEVRRLANIPDLRNDENLAVAQVHLAFARFHNQVVDRIGDQCRAGDSFERAREEVVKHYQTMLRDEYLPMICQPAVVADVFTNGRKVFEVARGAEASALDYSPADKALGFGSMPVEFSVGAFRMGHSMARPHYDWNRVFNSRTTPATLELLFRFSGTSGTLTPPAATPDSFDALPTSWAPNWHGLFDLRAAAKGVFPGNRSEKINTLLTPILASLPAGSFKGFDGGKLRPELQKQLAFRNLMRANMVRLASAQGVAELFRRARVIQARQVLSPAQILRAKPGRGADLSRLSARAKELIARATPLWFYVLREAEVLENGERLGPLGSRIVVETFQRSMETSRYSILKDPAWRPWLGKAGRFRMSDLLRVAFGRQGLNVLGGS